MRRDAVISTNPQDLHDAFLRAIANRPPSMSESLKLFRSSGATPEAAAKHMGIHPTYVYRVINGKQIVEHIRRKFIALLPI